MAPPRPYWKGYLKLSLVSCPIALYTATSSGERVAFRQINKKPVIACVSSWSTRGQATRSIQTTKAAVMRSTRVFYLRVEDEELDAIAIESSHTIDIDSFVPKSEVDERYVDSPYYLVPENKVALEAFAVIRDAMLGKGMVALGRVVLSKRERVIMLQPRGKGLPAPRSGILTRFATKRSISATSAIFKFQRTCSPSPSIFSKARRRPSTPLYLRPL